MTGRYPFVGHRDPHHDLAGVVSDGSVKLRFDFIVIVIMGARGGALIL